MKKKAEIQSEIDKKKAELDAKLDELNDIKNTIDDEINKLGDKPVKSKKQQAQDDKKAEVEQYRQALAKILGEDLLKPDKKEVKQEEIKGEEISDEELREKAERIFEQLKEKYAFNDDYDAENESWLKSFWGRNKENFVLTFKVIGFFAAFIGVIAAVYLIDDYFRKDPPEQTKQVSTASITQKRIDSIIGSHDVIKYEIYEIKRDSMTGWLIADIVKSDEKHKFNSIGYGYTGNINIHMLLDSLVELGILNADDLYDYSLYQMEDYIYEIKKEALESREY